MITVKCDLCNEIIAENKPNGVSADSYITSEIVLGSIHDPDYLINHYPKRYWLCDECSKKLADIVNHWNN